MWLSVGYLARHRAFSRLFRQVRRQLQPTIAAFDVLKIKNPMCNALLVDFTDEEGRDYFEVVENSDQFFQVLVGCCPEISEEQLIQHMIEALLRVVRLCPIASEDRARCETLFSAHHKLVTATGKQLRE